MPRADYRLLLQVAQQQGIPVQGCGDVSVFAMRVLHVDDVWVFFRGWDGVLSSAIIERFSWRADL